MPSHTFYKRCKAVALLQSTHKQRALEPKCQQTTVKARTIDGVTKTIIYMAPPSCTTERDPLNPMACEKKKTRSVTDLTALTLCRGTVPTCRRVARSANSFFSPFNVYIPVRSNVNNGSECAPLNFVIVAKAATAIAVKLDTKARAAQGTVVQLKNALGQSQQSEAKTRADSLLVITFKPPSEFGTDTVVGRVPGRLAGESLDRLGNPTFRMALQVQEQHVRLDKDQLTADLKMTEDALAEDTAAFEDTTQDCLAIQAKVADFDVHTNKSLSEDLEALAKAKAVISEKTDNAEYRDNRSVLSSRGGSNQKRELDRIGAACISC